MFKKITIELAGPICSCKTQDLSWGVNLDAKGRSAMFIACNRCATKLSVGHEVFVASFALDKAYPDSATNQKPDAKILKLCKTDDT
jgi:hypothetical protein